ncbi:MAG: universal stress protein [Clostridiales bacterium]|nr:universal stress protein [Clostridiales bacterium]
MFEKILLPVDRPDYDQKALDVALDMAKKYKSEVIVFNSQDISPNIYWVNDPVMVNRIPLNTEDIAKDIVTKVSQFFEGSGLKITEMTSIGDPASEILHVTENDSSIKLIIMATHGMTVSKRFLLGSVTNKVIHHAKIPVLVIR